MYCVFRGLLSARLAALLAVMVVLGAINPGHAAETKAERALVIDIGTGSILLTQNADDVFRPGSFAKLATAAVVFDALAAGELRPDQTLPISEHAWRTGGAPAGTTTMFAEVNSAVPVEALLNGLIVQLANDAAIALAEGLSGSEAAFAGRMDALADSLWLAATHFSNPTGLDDPESRTSVNDIAALAQHLIAAYPDQYPRYSLPDFTWNDIDQRNKTTLVRDVAGVDGLVLAYDEAAGYGGAISAVRDGRRVLVVASGYDSAGERASDLASLVEWAFGAFEMVQLYDAGEAVGTVRLYGGATNEVAVAGNAPLDVLLPTEDRDGIQAQVVYEGPVSAPIAAGQRIAHLQVFDADHVIAELPLYAESAVPRGGLFKRAGDALYQLLFGWW